MIRKAALQDKSTVSQLHYLAAKHFLRIFLQVLNLSRSR